MSLHSIIHIVYTRISSAQAANTLEDVRTLDTWIVRIRAVFLVQTSLLFSSWAFALSPSFATLCCVWLLNDRARPKALSLLRRPRSPLYDLRCVRLLNYRAFPEILLLLRKPRSPLYDLWSCSTRTRLGYLNRRVDAGSKLSQRIIVDAPTLL